MSIVRNLALLVFMLAFHASAAFVAVLETMSASGVVTREEKMYLTDVLRSEAVKALPAEQNFTIMTRENIIAMLPPGKTIEECEGECLVETGKNISADYVAQGRVGRFDGSLTITVELYETSTSKLIGSFSSKGDNIGLLESEIHQKSKDLFSLILAKAVGKINLQPAFSDRKGPDSELIIRIDSLTDRDGRKFVRGLWELPVGIHSFEFLHPCYETQKFQINVSSDKIIDVMNTIDVAMKMISLRTTYEGASRKSPVYVDGAEVGYTPWQGKVPVCAKIEVGDSSFREIVNVEWSHEGITEIEQELHKIKTVQNDILENSTRVAQQAAAKEAAKMVKQKEKSSIAKPVAITMAALGVASFFAGVYENSVLRRERDKYDKAKYDRQKDFDDQWEKVESAGTLRSVFWGSAAALIAGGVVVFFVF